MPSFQSSRLNAMLNAELATGNTIDEDSGGWGGMSRLMILRFPFRAREKSLFDGLERRDINDPHYWKIEIEDPDTKELLACKF